MQYLNSGPMVLQEFDTLKKGFVKLSDKYTQSIANISALEAQIITCRGESEQRIATLQEELRAQMANQVAALRVRANFLEHLHSEFTYLWISGRCVVYNPLFSTANSTTLLRLLKSSLSRSRVWYALKHTRIPTGISVGFRSGEKFNLCSLDCRHIFCGVCVASWFASERDTTCPECREVSVGLPRRDFALREILRIVYTDMGQEVPNYQDFDETIFTRIYEMLDGRANNLTGVQLQEFWAPTIAELRRMRGAEIPPTPPPPPPDEVIDVDMEEIVENNADVDWELDSVETEQDEGEEEL
jgi:hypothetical protein